jgi:hypothetical protein
MPSASAEQFAEQSNVAGVAVHSASHAVTSQLAVHEASAPPMHDPRHSMPPLAAH